MTISLKMHLEQLRAELRNAYDAEERRKIEAELATAEAKLAQNEAAFEALIGAEPPH